MYDIRLVVLLFVSKKKKSKILENLTFFSQSLRFKKKKKKMLFIRHDRQNLNKLRTNSERCSQVGALCGTILVIITAVLLYFAITTEHGEQKTVQFYQHNHVYNSK